MKIIKLTRGYEAIIDDEDYELVRKYKWQARVKHPDYVLARTRESVYMHHLVLGISKLSKTKRVVDHINRNPLDNRKENLRIVTYSENNLNSVKSDKVTGIYYDSNIDRWRVYDVLPYNKRIYLGMFKTKEEAVALKKAYNERKQCTQVSSPSSSSLSTSAPQQSMPTTQTTTE